ncbi:MAG: bifunctional glutamate N-acetyltransferase/amino-acid acetyltransferase ArgJ [Candidatus Saganbacteria bacterium]|nr:bifunctional glutamate N-acetyltransferase/amino-acid acetyltransferase ArgJ [Candidatus Saganbacteria bacterium]
MKQVIGGVTAPRGFLAAGLSAGIKQSGKPDLALIYSLLPCIASGVFTVNKMKAAPVLVSIEQITKAPSIQAIIANAGNANCATGKQGLCDAWKMVELTAEELDLLSSQVLVTSTGSIGKMLPMERVTRGIKHVVKRLSPKGGMQAARAIMTTDKLPKEISYRVSIGKQSFVIGGIAKGSGMIAPQMNLPHATMHAFITTDAAIDKKLLDPVLQKATEDSFNMVTVDNEMSTNDCVFVLANGMSGVKITKQHGLKEFKEALRAVCIYLAKLIAQDGEGANRLIEVSVKGAKNFKDARTVAKTVAGSELFKTAVFGGDPNFGRILSSAGASGAMFDPQKLIVQIGNVVLFKRGESFAKNQRKAEKFLRKKEVSVALDLGLGTGEAVAWGCDLSYDYVTINAKYHT